MRTELRVPSRDPRWTKPTDLLRAPATVLHAASKSSLHNLAPSALIVQGLLGVWTSKGQTATQVDRKDWGPAEGMTSPGVP